MDAANTSYSSLDGVLFNKDKTTLIQYPPGKAGNYSIPGGVTDIGNWAFESCASLTSVGIPGSVTYIGYYAFYGCTNLISITIPGSVTNIHDGAFGACTNLKAVFFKGNAPSFGSAVFDIGCGIGCEYRIATLYFLPGTTGWSCLCAPDWGSTQDGCCGSILNGPQQHPWNPLIQSTGPSFGVGLTGFGFNITGSRDIPIVVEACTNLADASWFPLQSLNLTNGAVYFSDPDWTNYPARSYRIRSP